LRSRMMELYLHSPMSPCRSQWPRGLRHELSSLARTVRSCVRIPLKAWRVVFILCLYM
jgi:hypothetical protein